MAIVALLLALSGACPAWTTPTNYALGAVYNVGGSCYQSINAVNSWVAPGTNGYFWSSVPCSCVDSASTAKGAPLDSSLLVAAGEVASSPTFWGVLTLGIFFGFVLAIKGKSVGIVIGLLKHEDRD